MREKSADGLGQGERVRIYCVSDVNANYHSCEAME